MASIGPRTSVPLSPLILQTLGGASLCLPGGAEVLGPGKPLALLIYLSCEPRATASRAHLLDLLWSDTEPDRARHALRQAIWYLRQVLGADVLRTSNGDLVLDAHLTSDRDRLLSAIGRGQCEEAVALYTGEFLHRFAVPGGAGFEHWADVERERLKAAFQRAAERTVRSWTDSGRFRDAQVLALRSRDEARSDESSWRLVFETLHATGDNLGLAMEAAALEEELSNEGRTPEPATRALLDAIERRAEPASASPVNPLLAELVGREQQFSRCLAAWNRVSQGRSGAHLHLVAAAGYGKSRILNDVRVRLLSSGTRCVSVRATTGQRDIPYSCVSDLVAALASLPGAAGVSPATASILVGLSPSLSGRFPVAHATGLGEDAVHRRSSAIEELCSVVAEEGPFMLQVDDLHWMDGNSRQILRALIERIEQYPCLVITTGRPGSHETAFGDLTETLHLQPLSIEHVGTLLSSLGSMPEASWSRELPRLLTESTLGSPLLILETLRLTIDRGDLRLDQDEWHCLHPAELRAQLTEGSALRHRLEQLDPTDREVLLLLASAGESLPLRLLRDSTDQSEALLTERLGILEQKGFVLRHGDGWQTAHDEIARESLATAPALQQSRAHARLGGALAHTAQYRDDYLRASRHLLLAGRLHELRGVLLAYFGLARHGGDSRRIQHLMRDLLPDADAPTLARLTGNLGRWNRLRYAPLRPGLVTGGTIAIVGLAGAALRSQPVPPEVEVVVVSDDSMTAAYQVPVSTGQWLAGEVLSGRHGDRPTLSLDPAMRSLAFTSDGDCVYYVRATGTDNTDDVFRRCRSGPEDTVIAGLRDDGFPSPSPDGSRLVYATSQWSPVGADNYDLAIQEQHTGRIIPLVRTALVMERRPAWSPDGSVIAFLRNRNSISTELCLVPPDSEPAARCVPNLPDNLNDIGGWVTPDQILLAQSDRIGQVIVRLTLSSGRLDTLARGAMLPMHLSQDGRWFTLLQLLPGHQQPRWFLFRTEAPGNPREIELTDEAETFSVYPVTSQGATREIASLEVVAPRADLEPGLPHQLGVIARNSLGREVTLRVPLTWSVRPAGSALIDQEGRVVPISGTRAEVTASIPGWRASTAVLLIRTMQPQVLMQERWDQGIADQWIAFGTPRPVIIGGPESVPAFLNNGDGSYGSGVYSRKGWRLGRGIAIETSVHASITRIQWQTLQIEFCGGCDSSAMGTWDFRTAAAPYEGSQKMIRSCGWAYPAGEGAGSEKFMIAVGRGLSEKLEDRTDLRSGGWHRLLIQLFSDGRCGFAVDGVARAMTRTTLGRDRLFHLLLAGKSVDTRMLVGPITVWRGIEPGVDWSRLPP